jgi:exopolyphosphatase/guanosine-5'-triphosphate,3'-diphosphate pyrophosphatase
MTAEQRQDSPPIVPRWEWRTFGRSFGDATERLDKIEPHAINDSDEMYLVSTRSDASVKIRDDLMDVKHLEAVDDNGLELWLPVMKSAFPLSSDELASVMGALGVPASDERRNAYTLEQLLDDVVGPNEDLLAVAVHKRRVRHMIDECMVELTEVSTADQTTGTLAIESADPALVQRTRILFGLDDQPNVCVARGLKALVGFGAHRFGVIDVGTNSVKFHLAERRADATVHTLVDRAEVTRLGEGLADAGRLDPAAVRRTVDAIAGMVDEARERGAKEIVAVGTAGLRVAPDRDAFVDAVRARSGIVVEVISGDDEARLAFLAATSALPLPRGPLVVFDSGGGSSQFSFGTAAHVDERFSVDVGAVRYAERFGLAGPVSQGVIDDALATIADDLANLDGRARPEAVIGMGGTSTNLAAVKHALASYDADLVHGTLLDLAEIDRQIERYRTLNAHDRRSIVGLQPARAEVILAGACIVRAILTKLGHTSMTVSDRGLRHGLFAERFGQVRGH